MKPDDMARLIRDMADDFDDDANCPDCKGEGVDKHGFDCVRCGGEGVVNE